MLIFPLNLNYKPTFYNMQFMKYKIVASSSILGHCDITKLYSADPMAIFW